MHGGSGAEFARYFSILSMDRLFSDFIRIVHNTPHTTPTSKAYDAIEQEFLDSRLPESSACFFTLYLPAYSSAAVAAKRFVTVTRDLFSRGRCC